MPYPGCLAIRFAIDCFGSLKQLKERSSHHEESEAATLEVPS